MICLCYSQGSEPPKNPFLTGRNLERDQASVRTCEDEGDLGGELGSLRLPGAESISNAHACSHGEAHRNLLEGGSSEKRSTESGTTGGGALRTRSYHVCHGGQLIYDGMRRQLHLADDARQESSDLVQPPLQTVHQHAGDGQFEERAPLLQALSGPAFSR